MINAPADAFASALGALCFPAPADDVAGQHSPQQGTSLVVALSGGCDSIVLLHLAWSYARRHELPLRAIHVNHQLQAAAIEFVRHCEQRCQTLNVPLEILTVAVARTGKGLEADARDARYAAFAASLKAGEILLLGQHADDQLETLMLQLLRGAGPNGLAAMPALARCGAGLLSRPLLAVRRSAIRALAEQQKWSWVEDPSNTDTALARNRLRSELMPVLLAQRDSAAEVLLRAVQWQAEAAGLLADLAAIDARAVQNPNGTLSRLQLLALSPNRQSNLLRGWLQQQGIPAPNADKLHNFLHQLPSESERILLRWGGHELRMAGDQIVALHALPSAPITALSWQMGSELALPNGLGSLNLQASSKEQSPTLLLRAPKMDEQVTVHWHTPCLKVSLSQRLGRRELKDIFQEYEVPAWLRPYWPRLFYNDTLVALPGLLVTAAGQPTETDRLQLRMNGTLFRLAARLRTPDAAPT